MGVLPRMVLVTLSQLDYLGRRTLVEKMPVSEWPVVKAVGICLIRRAWTTGTVPPRSRLSWVV